MIFKKKETENQSRVHVQGEIEASGHGATIKVISLLKVTADKITVYFVLCRKNSLKFTIALCLE